MRGFDLRSFKYTKEIIAVLILVIAILALYYTFTPVFCSNYECFKEKMAGCKSAVYINEQDEGSWRYEVLSTDSNSCAIQVTLLSAKNADLGLREYESQEMRCYYPIGIVGYPEKNLDACHGSLKEGLQKIVIEKLYKYIVANLGEIKEGLLF